MFGTLRRLATKVAAKLYRKEPESKAPTPLRRIPLVRMATPFLRAAINAEHHPHRYPFRACRAKIKGRRDRSLKARSNRRKAARKARAR